MLLNKQDCSIVGSDNRLLRRRAAEIFEINPFGFVLSNVFCSARRPLRYETS